MPAVRQKHRSFGRELDTPGASVQQGDAEGTFERFDLLADRLLSDVKVVSGAGEAAPLGDGDECPQLAQVEPGIRDHAACSLRTVAHVHKGCLSIDNKLCLLATHRPSTVAHRFSAFPGGGDVKIAASQEHHEIVDVTSTARPHVLVVVANPSIATTTGWSVGFWAAELTHPYYEFTKARYDVTIASPDGGKVEMDAFSDPRDESKWSADDLISMGFVNTPELMALLDDTPRLADLDLGGFDAIVVSGGQSPMFTYRGRDDLSAAILTFFEAEKPTAALCHGTCALLDVKTSDGRALIEGRTMTGFANVEEDYSDAAVGQKVMPFRIEDEALELGANFIVGGLFRAFAVRDGNLITGQQQYSGANVAQLVVQSLGV